MIARRAVLPCLLVLAACGSSPSSHFYTLSSSTGIPSGDVFPGDDRFSMGTVSIPGVLDKPQMIRKSGANEIEVLEYDRWAAPLDGMITHVLIEDMAARGGVSMPEAKSHTRHIDVSIDEMEADDSGQVTLKARWTVTPPGENAQPIPHNFEKSEGSAGGVEGDVAAESHLLGDLAEAILSH